MANVARGLFEPVPEAHRSDVVGSYRQLRRHFPWWYKVIVSVTLLLVLWVVYGIACRLMANPVVRSPCDDPRLAVLDTLPCRGFLSATGFCYIGDDPESEVKEYFYARVLYESPPYSDSVMQGLGQRKWSRDVTISHIHEGKLVSTRLRDAEAICIVASGLAGRHTEL